MSFEDHDAFGISTVSSLYGPSTWLSSVLVMIFCLTDKVLLSEPSHEQKATYSLVNFEICSGLQVVDPLSYEQGKWIEKLQL